MKTNINKIVAYSTLGTLFEWYDLMIYTVAASVIFGKLFFPPTDPAAAQIASLVTIGLSFLAKPIGAIFFGHIGDKYGRRTTLIWSMVLMAIATVSIGFLPTYAEIGIAATWLLVLFRLLQGIAFGGEWTGASLMIYENAPENRKSFYGSFIQIGLPIATLMAAGMFALLDFLSKEEFLDWGWRIPFLFSFLLGFFSFYARLNLSETVEFQALQSKKQTVKLPIAELFKEPMQIVKGVGLKLTEITWGPLLVIVTVAYMVGERHIPRETMLHAVWIGSVFHALAIPFFGWLGDNIGNKRLFKWGALTTIVVAYPVFYIIDSGHYILGLTLGWILGNAFLQSTLPSIVPQLFKPNVRYTGSSLSMQIGAAIGLTTVPVLGGWMAKTYGLPSVSILLIVAALLTYSAVHNINE
jgi:MHS family shikimate/dehydroshikimate transporter-like MFS transporter